MSREVEYVREESPGSLAKDRGTCAPGRVKIK
jgi:hypothetical protein